MTGSLAPSSFTGTVGEYLDAGQNPVEIRADDEIEGTEALVAFVDSSALVALADAGDASHEAAVAAYHDLISSGYRLFTTDAMTVETFDLLRSGPGLEVAREWLRGSRLAVFHTSEQDLARARRRVLEHTGPEGISLSDAISLVVLERLGVTDVFAVDQSVLGAIS